MGQNLIPGSTVGIITTSSGMRPATLTGIPASAPGIPTGTSNNLGTAVRTPNGQIMMMAPAGTMQPLTRPTAGKLQAITRAQELLQWSVCVYLLTMLSVINITQYLLSSYRLALIYLLCSFF